LCPSHSLPTHRSRTPNDTTKTKMYQNTIGTEDVTVSNTGISGIECDTNQA